MSRDRYLEVPNEHARPAAQSAGRELPRGGRSGGASRHRPERPTAGVRDALSQQLDLPRGEARQRVTTGGCAYHLNAAEWRVMAAIGAFRVADQRDVAADSGAALAHLQRDGLITATPHRLDGERTQLLTLTAEGRALLRHIQRPDDEPRQTYYAGVVKPRELTHDAQLYRAYAAAAERLARGGNTVRRVVLDYELKRDYQRFLQANNRAQGRTSGRPDRSPEEVRTWAAEHRLPVTDGRVQFPDVRIEYERPDGERVHEDLELATGHYNSRQMAAKRASGFTLHQSRASHLRGANSRSGGAPFDPHAAEQVLG